MVNTIIDLTTSLKNDKDDAGISNIMLRTDNKNLNEKRCLVNRILAEMCKVKNIYLINHSEKIKSHHLNRGKLYLNEKGSTVLRNTFYKRHV